MRPFNLEEAKAGKPVCTRSGRAARIVCFDKLGSFPVVALVKDGYNESVICYRTNGGVSIMKGHEHRDDLFLKD